MVMTACSELGRWCTFLEDGRTWYWILVTQSLLFPREGSMVWI